MPQIVVNRERCKGCERCTAACPQKILGMSKEINAKGYFVARVEEPMRCIGCRICCITCPDMALTMQTHGTLYHYFSY